MVRVSYTIALILGVATLVGLPTVNAEVFAPKDSADFTYQYEMDVVPSIEDLDVPVGNGVDDFTQFVGDSTSASATGGILTLDGGNDISLNNRAVYYTAGSANQIWRNSGITASTGYTIEAKVKVVSQLGAWGTAWLFAGCDTGDSTYLNFRDDGIGWGPTATATWEANTTDTYHVYRLAMKQGVYSLWMDGTLLSDALTASNVGVAHQLDFGDEGTSWNGVTMVDYLRFTSGAYAPVPEPSSVMLLVSAVVGLLAYAWRKRR